MIVRDGVGALEFRVITKVIAGGWSLDGLFIH